MDLVNLYHEHICRIQLRSTGEDHLHLGTCPGEAGWTCPVPEDHQVHWGRPPTTGDSPTGPDGVLGLGETGKGNDLGEVRVDRTSVAYLVHAIRGGGPVGGGTVAYSRGWGPTRSTGEDHLQGRLGGPVPCLRTTRSTGEDPLRLWTRPFVS